MKKRSYNRGIDPLTASEETHKSPLDHQLDVAHLVRFQNLDCVQYVRPKNIAKFRSKNPFAIQTSHLKEYPKNEKLD